MMQIMFSILLLFTKHPLSIGLMLMIQTIWTSIMIGMNSFSFWFSYILFITFLGGMLILFIYMTSLYSNENFKFSMNLFIMCLNLMFIIMFIIYMFNINLLNYNNKLDSLMNSLNINIPINYYMLNKLYMFPNNMITILLMIYLFISLICTIKITDLFQGPLRKKY
uniref:NADH-ubiquinone oxidoreductase chain 6 n=1 Tax=Xenopsylla cheopis TaxID=163159 RepID=A0A8F5XUQ8_XENCH|nr:NADH dehydrogenase subunit 6 [Xenopsylla cheopis]